MKGVSFQSGVEFRIVIEGECWPQGSTISGKLESKPASAMSVFLAEGIDKKVKQKSPGAFRILERASTQTSPLDWSFSLPLHTRVSDSSGSLYLVYGGGSEKDVESKLETLGQLRLNILPHQHLLDLIEVMTGHFRFAWKSTAASKTAGWTQVKFDAPQAREWASLELLLVQVQLTDQTMDVNFLFNRKEIDPAKAGLSSVVVKRELSRSWELKKIIHDFNQRLNKEIITVELERVIAEYRDAGWLKG